MCWFGSYLEGIETIQRNKDCYMNGKVWIVP